MLTNWLKTLRARAQDERMRRNARSCYRRRQVRRLGGIEMLEDRTLLSGGPVFAASDYEFMINEAVEVGTIAGWVYASDPDGYDMVIYDFMGDSGPFAIDDFYGFIYVTEPLSHDQQEYYDLTVEAFLWSTWESTTVEVTIQVRSDAPIFDPDDYTVSIPEDAPAGTSVVQVIAHHPDTPSDGFEYVITDVDGGPFQIDSTSGHITTTGELDYETKTFYLVDVEAIALNGRSAFTTVLIDVIDIDDEPPVFDSNPWEASIGETTPIGTLVMVITALDPDTPYYQLTYTIHEESTDHIGYFELHPNTGALITTAEFDYDDEWLFTFIVVVTDPAGNFDLAVVQVTILEEDTKPPVFEPNYYEFTVPANKKAGQVVGTVIAFDPDTELSDLTYTIIAGPSWLFDFWELNTLMLAVDLTESEMGIYELTIEVKDTGGQTDTALVVIDITAPEWPLPEVIEFSASNPHEDQWIFFGLVYHNDPNWMTVEFGSESNDLLAGQTTFCEPNGYFELFLLLEFTGTRYIWARAIDWNGVPGPKYNLTIDGVWVNPD